LLNNVQSLGSGSHSLGGLSQLSYPGTFYIVYQGYNDRDVMTGIREGYYRALPSVDRSLAWVEGGGRGKRVRVGFVSSYFRRHSVCKLFCGMITGLDREKFEPVVFAHVQKRDEVTEEVRESVGEDNWVDVGERGFLLSNSGVVGEMKVDVLVYLDIGMDNGSSMWAFSR